MKDYWTTFEDIIKYGEFQELRDGSLLPSEMTLRRLFLPGYNRPRRIAWLEALCDWVRNHRATDSPSPGTASKELGNTLCCLVGPQNAAPARGSMSFRQEVAGLFLECARLAACAKHLTDVESAKFNKSAWDDMVQTSWRALGLGDEPPSSLAGSAGQVRQSWVAASADPTALAAKAMELAAAGAGPISGTARPDTWHLRQIGPLLDIVRILLDKPETAVRPTCVMFALVRETEPDVSKAVASQFVFEVLSSEHGQVFINPEQAFLRLKASFDDLFDRVPRAVESLMRDRRDPPNNRDVRVTINRVEPPHAPALEYADTLEGDSGTGAAGRGLYFALTGKVPDTGVAVLAALNELGMLRGVDGLKRKIPALVACGGIDTILVADEGETHAKSILDNLVNKGVIRVGEIVVNPPEKTDGKTT